MREDEMSQAERSILACDRRTLVPSLIVIRSLYRKLCELNNRYNQFTRAALGINREMLTQNLLKSSQRELTTFAKELHQVLKSVSRQELAHSWEWYIMLCIREWNGKYRGCFKSRECNANLGIQACEIVREGFKALDQYPNRYAPRGL